MESVGPSEPRSKALQAFAFAFPPALVLLFFAIYLISPRLYLKYILEFHDRESQAVEILTVAFAAIGAAILIPLGLHLWARTARTPGRSKFPGGASLIVVVGLAAFFFAGEELSWGQSIFHWKTPADVKEISRETNLHNGKLGVSVHALGNLFIIASLVALPIAWRWRRKLRLPADWGPAIAEWPVATCVVLAVAMRFPKQVWMETHTDAQLHASRFYEQYLEEISEQKEMLIALALAMYAFYRIRAARRERRALRDSASPDASITASAG